MQRTRQWARWTLVLCIWLVGAGVAVRADEETSFTIAVAPDMQQEVLDPKDTRMANRFQWLVDHRDELRLQCFLQVGDLHNWDTPDHGQYERSSAAFQMLDRAGLPYILTIGNHDSQATGGTPEHPGGSARPGNTHDNQRNTSVFNHYYPLSRFKLLGGVWEPGKIDNAWHTFHAGGLDWLVLNFELWPRADAVAWAKTVVEQHPSYNVILLTHSFLSPGPGGPTIQQNNGGYGDNSPQYVFNELVKPYPNIRMILCGHAGSHGYRVDKGANGNDIYEFLQCYHDNQTNPVRLLTIDTAAGTIKSRVVCPSLNKDKEDGSTFEVTGVQWVSARTAAASLAP
jgi:hypothetical protein